MKHLLLVPALTLLTAGCNTMHGLGEDMSAAGTALSGSARQTAGVTVPRPATGTSVPTGAASGSTSAGAQPMTRAPVMRISPDTIKEVQSSLRDQNLYRGPIDGIIGRRTHAALAEYQQQKGLAPTGHLDDATLRHITSGRTETSNPPAQSQPLPAPTQPTPQQ